MLLYICEVRVYDVQLNVFFVELNLVSVKLLLKEMVYNQVICIDPFSESVLCNDIFDILGNLTGINENIMQLPLLYCNYV